MKHLSFLFLFFFVSFSVIQILSNVKKDPLKREVDLFYGDFQELLPCG